MKAGENGQKNMLNNKDMKTATKLEEGDERKKEMAPHGCRRGSGL